MAFGRPYIANPDLVVCREYPSLPKWIGKPSMPRGPVAIPITQPTNHRKITQGTDHAQRQHPNDGFPPGLQPTPTESKVREESYR